jgi:DNA-binding CsgD family transcriptional regulator
VQQPFPRFGLSPYDWHSRSAPHGMAAQPIGMTLTRREHEVLDLLLNRYSNREIADHLSIGVRTAESHVANVLAKLGARSRREVATIVTRG